MFTGIIDSIGIINNIKNITYNNIILGINVKIKINPLIYKGIKKGDSISINGICSTIVIKKEKTINVNISNESLKKISPFNNKVVNLEKSINIIKKYVGGHFVSGHIDTVGYINKIKRTNNFWKIIIKLNKKFKKFIIKKGSICINGISLTINKIRKKKNNIYININIIPYTLYNSNILYYKIKEKINIEFDIFGKYIINYLKKIKI